VTIGDIYRGAIPFVVIQLIMVALVIGFPGLVTGGLDRAKKIDLNTIRIEAPGGGYGGYGSESGYGGASSEPQAPAAEPGSGSAPRSASTPESTPTPSPAEQPGGGRY
jgi:hypothetical protein